jgi:hypothetical protein
MQLRVRLKLGKVAPFEVTTEARWTNWSKEKGLCRPKVISMAFLYNVTQKTTK